MTFPTPENLAAWSIDSARLNDLRYLLNKHGEAAVEVYLNCALETSERYHGIARLIADLHGRQRYGLSFALGFAHSGCVGESKDCLRDICVEIRTARDGAA
jgi:hypothetical protein